MLLTGARAGELAALRWEDVDLQWNAMVIRDKVEGERTIPLTPYVRALLLNLKASNVLPIVAAGRPRASATPKASPWVFPSTRSPSGKRVNPITTHKRACAAAGLGPITLHGLRRSFGSLAEWIEVPAGVVAQIMGHKPSATAEKHYRRRPLDLLRQWHTKIEAWILEQAGIDFVPEKAGLQLVKNTAA